MARRQFDPASFVAVQRDHADEAQRRPRERAGITRGRAAPEEIQVPVCEQLKEFRDQVARQHEGRDIAEPHCGGSNARDRGVFIAARPHKKDKPDPDERDRIARFGAPTHPAGSKQQGWRAKKAVAAR